MQTEVLNANLVAMSSSSNNRLKGYDTFIRAIHYPFDFIGVTDEQGPNGCKNCMFFSCGRKFYRY
jgi:hypothetical protein